jgi:hypothetical protein
LDADGDLVVGPNASHHIVNELLWKTLLDLPAWMAEGVEIITPNSENDFSRIGVSVDLLKQKSYGVTLTGTCAIRGDFDWSTTVTVSGAHNLLDGK